MKEDMRLHPTSIIEVITQMSPQRCKGSTYGMEVCVFSSPPGMVLSNYSLHCETSRTGTHGHHETPWTVAQHLDALYGPARRQ